MLWESGLLGKRESGTSPSEDMGYKIVIAVIAIVSVLVTSGITLDVFAHKTGAYIYTDRDEPVADYADWMGFLPDDAKITSLSIPGTHNTMTDTSGNGPGLIVRNQAMNLDDQLTSGIRALDIRASFDGDGGGFGVFHGCVYVDDRLDTDVFTVLDNFLGLHPTETIIMNLQKRYRTINSGLLREQKLR